MDTLQVFCARPALHYVSERNSRRRSDWTHVLTPCSQSCQLTCSVRNCPGEAGPGAWASASHQGDRQMREMDQEDAPWRTGWGMLQIKADGRGQSSVCGRVSGRQRAESARSSFIKGTGTASRRPGDEVAVVPPEIRYKMYS